MFNCHTDCLSNTRLTTNFQCTRFVLVKLVFDQLGYNLLSSVEYLKQAAFKENLNLLIYYWSSSVTDYSNCLSNVRKFVHNYSVPKKERKTSDNTRNKSWKRGKRRELFIVICRWKRNIELILTFSQKTFHTNLTSELQTSSVSIMDPSKIKHL